MSYCRLLWYGEGRGGVASNGSLCGSYRGGDDKSILRTSVYLTSEHEFAVFAYNSIVSLDEELS